MSHAPLILDLAGPRLAAHERRRLQHPRVGGLILFTRNWQDRHQLLRLIAELKDLRPDLLVCIDHEGGRVQRLRGDGFTDLPAMAELGERWMRDAPGAPGSGALHALDAATACGHVLAAELRACGVDLSFAPVLDLDHGRNAAIGRRALHRDPRVVATLGRAVMHGLLQAGMANCGKHFPGHGWAQADTHVAIASDERTLAQILADDALPYAHLGSALRAVMPAHVIYPQVDALPAGFSARWLGEVLRGRLGFDGATFSDDLGMAAARRLPDPAGGADRELSFTDAALHALQAGCDLVLACNQSAEKKGATLDALLDGLERAADEGRWAPDPDSETRRLALLPISPPLAWDELMHDPSYLRAQEILHDTLGPGASA